MRVVTIALIMLVSLAGLAFGQATTTQEEVDYIVCDYSGLRWDTSPTRIEISVFHGDVESSYHFASLYSMLMFLIESSMEGEDIGDLGEFKMLDYDSFGTDELVWIVSGGDAPPEMFAVHTLKEIAGSDSPYMAVFSTEEAADAKAKEWGGDVYDAETAMVVLQEIIEEELEARYAGEEPGADAAPHGEGE